MIWKYIKSIYQNITYLAISYHMDSSIKYRKHIDIIPSGIALPSREIFIEIRDSFIKVTSFSFYILNFVLASFSHFNKYNMFGREFRLRFMSSDLLKFIYVFGR